MAPADRAIAGDRQNWKGIHRRPWFAGLRHGVHRRPVRPASVLGPLAAVFVTAAVGAFALSDIGVPAAGPQPVVLPGICSGSDCAGTPSPTATTTPGRSSSERASRSTAHTTRPTQTPTLTATKPPPAAIPEAPTASPSMTVCPPPLPPTKPSKSKKPKGKPSPSPTPIDLTTDSRTRGGTGRRDRT